MAEKPERPWLDNVLIVDEDGMTNWICGQPTFSICWSEIETVFVDVDPYVSGPRPCEAFWVIAGAGKCIKLPLRGKRGLDELNLRLVVLSGFDHNALREALEAEAAFKGGDFLCWRR
jgi:hypothetical protein